MINDEEELLLSSSLDKDDDDADFDADMIMFMTRIGRKKQKIENFIEDVVCSYTDEDFQRNFRLSKIICEDLIDKFESNQFPHNIGGIQPKSAETHILAFLWYTSNKSTFRSSAERFNMSISTLFETNDRVMSFLLHIAPSIIHFPHTNAEKDDIAAEYLRLSRIPGVVGTIDGSFIPVSTPAHKIRSTYVNRHYQISITLQAICDAEKRFLDCFSGFPSRCHDSRIFRSSFIYPTIQHLGNDYHILGDAAYGLSNNVLTPFKNYRPLTQQERIFNNELSKARVTIENSFALLKNRFRHTIRFDLKTVEKSANYIICCCVLHNLALEEEDNDIIDRIDLNADHDNYGNNNYYVNNNYLQIQQIAERRKRHTIAAML